MPVLNRHCPARYHLFGVMREERCVYVTEREMVISILKNWSGFSLITASLLIQIRREQKNSGQSSGWGIYFDQGKSELFLSFDYLYIL